MEFINPVAMVRKGVEDNAALKKISAAMIATETTAQIKTELVCEEVILSK